MTRKDYVIIAAAIAKAREETYNHGSDAWYAVDVVAGQVADALAADNSRFDKARFVEACGA